VTKTPGSLDQAWRRWAITPLCHFFLPCLPGLFFSFFASTDPIGSSNARLFAAWRSLLRFPSSKHAFVAPRGGERRSSGPESIVHELSRYFFYIRVRSLLFLPSSGYHCGSRMGGFLGPTVLPCPLPRLTRQYFEALQCGALSFQSKMGSPVLD